jgi:hypothetical protein
MLLCEKCIVFIVFFNTWVKVLNEIDCEDSMGFVNPIYREITLWCGNPSDSL